MLTTNFVCWELPPSLRHALGARRVGHGGRETARRHDVEPASEVPDYTLAVNSLSRHISALKVISGQGKLVNRLHQDLQSRPDESNPWFFT